MKRFIIGNDEKERIKFLYESKGILLSEDSIWGTLARVSRKLIGQNEDDIAKALKTTEVALTKSLDDIILNAVKTKNISAADNLQAQMMHYFNPSGTREGIAAAQEQVKNFLNGYAKSKGKSSWNMIRDEISGVTSSTLNNALSGQRVSNRWYGWKPENIDFTKFSNPQTTFDQLNKSIATAIKTGNWNLVPRAGFEKLGVTNFREFLQNNISKINEIEPSIGRWSVNFK